MKLKRAFRQWGPGLGSATQDQQSDMQQKQSKGASVQLLMPCHWVTFQAIHVTSQDVLPSTLAMTVVTSKLAASAAIITPPGRPRTRNLASTLGVTPRWMACITVKRVT